MKQLLWIFILISSINHAQDNMPAVILNGRSSELRALIGQGADVNALLEEDGEQVTPLRLAVRANNLEMVKILIEAGANPNSDQESLPLHVAAFNGNFDILRYLLSKGAALTHPVTGWTALHSAASGGHIEIADYLIAQGVNINSQDEDGQTPLMYASEYPIPLVKLLVSKGAELNLIDASGETALDWANRLGRKRPQTAKYLKILGAMQGDAIHQQLFAAVRSDDAQAVATLAAKGISMNILYEDTTPLVIATLETQNPDMIKLLYQLGADLSLEDPAIQASYLGFNRFVRILADMGAPLRNLKTGWTALHSAVSGGHTDLAEWLIVIKSLDVNAQDEDGETPLMYATRHTDMQLIKLLLAKGADVNLKDNDGQTAYDWAVRRDNLEAAEYLKKLMGGAQGSPAVSGEDMAKAIQEGNTKKIKELVKKGFNLSTDSSYGGDMFIELAAYHGTLETVKTLVDLGADPKIGGPLIIAAYRGEEDILKYLISQGSALTNPTGWTALHAAASGGHAKIVEYLLTQGQNPNAQDEDGESPLMYAAQTNIDVVRVLINAGADPFLQDNKDQTALKWAMNSSRQDVISYFNTEYPSLRPIGSLLGIILEGDTQILNEADPSIEEINGTYHYHDATEGTCLGELTPLQIAGHNGNLDMIKALIALGADVSAANALGDTASALAGQAGHAEVVRFFRTTYPDMYSRWDILQIIQSRDPEILRAANLPKDILSAKYHYHDENGDCFGDLSLLQIAIVGGDLAMTEALAILGVSISENYPVMAAAYRGYTNITSYLISQGSPLSIPEQGWTALHSAAEGGHAPMIEFLITQKQDVNAINTSGQTPLMLASGVNLGAVQALIKANADVRLLDTNGKNALDYAIDSEKNDIVEYYNTQYPRMKPRVPASAETSAKRF